MRYQEGDIIVVKDYTYVCRIVGETESFFEKRWYRGLFKNPEDAYGSSGCGGREDFQCSDSVIIYTDLSKNSKNSAINNSNTSGFKEYLYPVIGSYFPCSTEKINLPTLRWNYEEEYKKYIAYLASSIECKDTNKNNDN